MLNSSELSQKGFTSKRDLAIVCRAFVAACHRHVGNRHPSWDVESIGQELLAAYQRGVRVEEELVKIALYHAHTKRRFAWRQLRAATRPRHARRRFSPRFF